ncbi:hypothetical protein BJ165DRAFT_1399237 [Panaeolus papilionaceus]|nr:hypothetical protein BJ165DRAFT_1399237 [Panaeolus papilionaceus]
MANSFLIGAYFNLILYTLDAVGVHIKALKKRPPFAEINRTIGTLAACYITWSLCLWWVCNTVASILIQSFMIRRFWYLSKNIIVTSFISLIMLASLSPTSVTCLMEVNQRCYTSKSRNLRVRYHDMASVVSLTGPIELTPIQRGGCVDGCRLAGRVYVATMLSTLLYRDRIADIRHSIHVIPQTSTHPDVENGIILIAVIRSPNLNSRPCPFQTTPRCSDFGIQTHDTLRFGHHSNINLPTLIDDSEVVLGHPERNNDKKNVGQELTSSTSS